MKSDTWISALTALAVCTAACAATEPWLSVKTSPDARPYELTAANELRTYLKRVFSGGGLTVDGNGTVVFHVGDTALAREKGLGAETFKDEE